MGILEEVRAHYEASPYPPLGLLSPFLQPVRRDERVLVNYRAAYAASYGSLAGAAEKPRIAVVGCGTFEAVAIALANPGAEIVAIDLSERSLRHLRWQAFWRGLGKQIKTLQCDLHQIPAHEGPFDFFVATGVIHHLPKPLLGLQALLARATARPVFRCMIYSRWGRSLLYGTKSMAEAMGVRTPKDLRRMIAALPADHPYRIYFHLYEDSQTDAGLSDGYLHPCDQAFTALELERLLEAAGLQVSRFLHHPDGQPTYASHMTPSMKSLTDWERLAVLEIYGDLQENFLFFARPAGLAHQDPGQEWEWNEALPQRGRVFSKLLGEYLEVDKSQAPREPDKLKAALFVLPKGKYARA